MVSISYTVETIAMDIRDVDKSITDPIFIGLLTMSKTLHYNIFKTSVATSAETSSFVQPNNLVSLNDGFGIEFNLI